MKDEKIVEEGRERSDSASQSRPAAMGDPAITVLHCAFLC